MPEPDEAVRLKCAAQHFGPWWIEPGWIRQAVAAVNAGIFEARPRAGDDAPPPYTVDGNGIARVQISGFMAKGDSSLGGTSTIRTRAAIRKAVQDDSVKAILLHIDSPGGTVAGSRDLAADVVTANRQKPVYAHIDDLGASAAYNVASGSRRITANPTAIVGSIGTITVLADSSGKAEAEGVKVHVITTAKHKGTGVPGAPIDEEQLAAAQHLIDTLGQHFVDHVNTHRGLDLKPGEGAADGRVFVGEEARQMGLIDAVASYDQAVGAAVGDLIAEAGTPRLRQAKAARRGREIDLLGATRPSGE